MIIDSANLQCNNCGIVVNHHVMLYPDGWSRFDSNIDYCGTCTETNGLVPGQYNKGMHLLVEAGKN